MNIKNNCKKFYKNILRYDPSSYPLYSILKNRKELNLESRYNKFSWIEKTGLRKSNFLQVFIMYYRDCKDSYKYAYIEQMKQIEKVLFFGVLSKIRNQSEGIISMYSKCNKKFNTTFLNPTINNIYSFLR
jgi:hypothetical protein